MQIPFGNEKKQSGGGLGIVFFFSLAIKLAESGFRARGWIGRISGKTASILLRLLAKFTI